ncbi:hypothetical protein GGI15_000484 [Coemansia interrupta]|uniref:Mitotic-spindle organizing protein 1 n=1 Tax=Coemansia interrupta TaxID=1126814 RepID=A0A9W8HPJ8_9FUNG|nr:hypothetical protein GGI15_000484 [Coemansia interrupta]
MNNYSPYEHTRHASARGSGITSEGDVLDILGQLANEVGSDLTKAQLAAAMDLFRMGLNPSVVLGITQVLRQEAASAQSAAVSPAPVSAPFARPPQHQSLNSSSSRYTRQQSYSRRGYSPGPSMY